ncbi:MAG TPA: transglycosylase domain-containing protein [Acidimicrobiia bacterium]
MTTTRGTAADQRGVVQRPHRQRVRRGPWARALTTATAASVVLLAAGCAFNPDLDPRPLNPSASTRVLAADGSQLALLDAGIHRQPISLSQMAATLPNAVVALEDHGFFDHDGVDLKSIARALRDDVKAGKVVEGGSTITQQYVRNVLLTGDKTVHRKLKEMVLAVEVEGKLSKKQILERYLNAVYFGDGAYGAQEAAEHYFGHPASQLTLVQSATLAGLLQAPDRDDPFHDPTAARARRNDALAAMAKYHYITAAQATTAEAAPLQLAEKTNPDDEIAPYFVEQVRQWFLSNPTFGATEADRAHALYQDGYTITTTLDPSAQAAAETSVSQILVDRATDPAAAVVSIEPKTGHVVAYVGGRGYDGPEAWSHWDLAGQAARPMGSTFKPFVLAAALEQHIPLSRIYDAPAQMTLHPPGDVPWTVHNYDNEAFGKLNIVDATVNSVNTVYAQLMLDVGPQYAVSLAERAGLPSTLGAYPSEVLGDNDVHPLDVADAYATFAADGVHTSPVFVTKVTDRNGKVVYTDHTPHKQVIDPQIARTVNHTLEQVVSRGTGVNARIGRPVAGKTGTTDNYDDAWFVGSTPQLTTAVWVGSGSTPYAMLPPRTREKVTGGTWPAEIWQPYSSEVLGNVPMVDFPEPSAATGEGILPTHPLPDVTGMPQGEAASSVHDNGYTVKIVTEPNDQYPPGTVIDETPEGGTPLPARAVVTLTVAKADTAPRDTTVPSMLGLSRGDAAARASGAGLALQVVVQAEPPPGTSSGSVWQQSLTSGERVPMASVLKVWVEP